jgi:hypothetical protein
VGSFFREETKDFAHHAIALIGLEEELSVRRSIEDDQFLRLGGFLVLCANSGEARPVSARVLLGDNEKAGGFEPISREIGR